MEEIQRVPRLVEENGRRDRVGKINAASEKTRRDEDSGGARVRSLLVDDGRGRRRVLAIFFKGALVGADGLGLVGRVIDEA